MVGRIMTARHGMPNLSREVRLSAREYGDWWARYDESGLHPDEKPPASLIEAGQTATHVICSTLPRAIETAGMITDETRTVRQDVLYIEAPLPPPPVPFIKLKPGTWGVISRSFWFLGFAPGKTENHLATWRRVSVIADKLTELAAEGDVVLCAHGYLNWMIDRHMRKNRGWKRVARDGQNNYWSWRAYKLPAMEIVTPQQPAAEAAE